MHPRYRIRWILYSWRYAHDRVRFCSTYSSNIYLGDVYMLLAALAAFHICGVTKGITNVTGCTHLPSTLTIISFSPSILFSMTCKLQDSIVLFSFSSVAIASTPVLSSGGGASSIVLPLRRVFLPQLSSKRVLFTSLLGSSRSGNTCSSTLQQDKKILKGGWKQWPQ